MTKPKYKQFWVGEAIAGSNFRGGDWTEYACYDSEMENPRADLHVIELKALTDLQEQCDRLAECLYLLSCELVQDNRDEIKIGERILFGTKALAEYRKWKNNKGENE